MQIRQNKIYIQEFKTAVYWVVQNIDDFDLLKRSVNSSLYKKYVKDRQVGNVEVDPDIKTEYDNQEKFLKNSVNTLKKRLEKESQVHKEDNLSIMNDNIKLIDMINKLRNEVTDLEI